MVVGAGGGAVLGGGGGGEGNGSRGGGERIVEGIVEGMEVRGVVDGGLTTWAWHRAARRRDLACAAGPRRLGGHDGGHHGGEGGGGVGVTGGSYLHLELLSA